MSAHTPEGGCATWLARRSTLREHSLRGEGVTAIWSTGVRLVLIPLLVCSLAAIAPAAKIPFERVWRAPQVIEIPIGREPQTASVDLPAIPRRDKAVACLRFAARLHTAQPGGWNQYLALEVNGAALGPLTQGGDWRLLNWPRLVESAYPGEPKVSLFRARSGLDCLLVFFSPDASQVDPRIRENRHQGCWYLIDASDALSADRGNTLKFTNTALASYWPEGPPTDCRMVIEDLQAGYLPAAQAKRLRRSEWKERTPVPGVTISGPAGALTVAPGGGIEIMAGKELYCLESSFTCLTKPHELVCARKSRGWEPAITKSNDGSLKVTASGGEFRLLRTIRHRGHRIEVGDSLTNLSGEVVGIVVRHEMILPAAPKWSRLAGTVESAVAQRTCPENPTVFAAQQRSGMGLVAEDDVLRLQMGSEVVGNRVCLYVENFGLAPGRSHTFHFALYPTTSDYYDFVNAVRRDWKVNFTVLGPFEFVPAKAYQELADAEKLKALLARKKIRLFALSPWFEYYDDPKMTRQAFKELQQRAIKLIKSVQPDAICLALMETNLYQVPFTWFKGTLPADIPFGRPGSTYPVGKTPGDYNWPAPPAVSAIVNESQWRDSVFRDEQGRVILDTWYVHNYVDPPALNLKVYPAPGNYREKNGLEQIAFLLDEVGFDGVYIDQFSLAFNPVDHFTYDYWDGCTVDLDPATGKVTRRYADVSLLGARARKAWVEAVLSRGKVVVANTMPAVMELQSLPTFRFMETQGYDPLAPGIPEQPVCAEGQLASPIGLGHQWWYDGAKPGAEFFMRTVCAHLRYGLLYYYYATEFPPEDGEFGAVNHMFPFTPVALHEGWVEGQERTITCISGIFAWRQSRAPVVRVFDRHGREKKGEVEASPVKGGYEVRVRLDDWREVAVIE